MAGIGFELRKILKKDTYFSELTAYLYAALVSSGPWLMSVLCLSMLGLYRGAGAGDLDSEIFRSTIIYTYAFSLIFVGLVQLPVTRYLADRFYFADNDAVLPAFFTSCLMILAVGAPMACAGYWNFELSATYKAMAVVLFLIVCLIWLTMIFLSAVKDYMNIVYSFVAGTTVSVVGAVVLDAFFDLDGFLIGYTAGQAVIFFWLLARLLAEFPAVRLLEMNMVAYLWKFWDLTLVGLAYNLGIWIDKIIFWFAPASREIVPYFRTQDAYEAPIFFAYLTIVPTLATFLLKIETRFYEHYRGYYDKIMQKRSYRRIIQEKDGMVSMLKEAMREVFIIQGALTGACMAFAPYMAAAVGLSPIQIPLLRIGLMGAFLQALLSMVVIILFYFDLRRRVFVVIATFLFTNTGFTLASIVLGPRYYGYGYCYACLVSLVLGFFVLSKSLDELEFITFAKQPLA